MGKLLRFRALPFPRSSLSLSSHSVEQTKTNQSHSSPAIIRTKALEFLNRCKSSIHLFQIQSQLITSGLFQDPSFSGRLLKLSSSLIGDSCYTFFIFKSIDFPDAFCVNSVIKSYSCGEYHGRAVEFYLEMLRDGNFYPNGFTFPPLISACSKLGRLSLGQMCHCHALKLGVGEVLPVQNSLVHFYSCCGLLDVACRVFDEMPLRDLVTCNTIVGGFAKVGEMESAHKVFDAMPRKNVISWNVMLTGYMNFRNPGNVLKLFREMTVQGFDSNDTTVVLVIAACGRSNRLKEGKSLHAHLVKVFPSSSLIIDTAIVDMYSKCGRVDIAQVVFDKMPSMNIVSWNAMILGHCIHGNPIDGIDLYSKMVNENRADPDEVTFIGVLCACARLGNLTDGKRYFSHMTEVLQVKSNFAHYWCMANLMAKVGLTHEAMNVLTNIRIDDEVSREYSLWAGLFGSCRFFGDVTVAEQIAKEMIEGDPWNFSHYNLLVNIYALAGRWEEVARTKDTMKEKGFRKMPCSNLKDLKEMGYFCDKVIHHLSRFSSRSSKDQHKELLHLFDWRRMTFSRKTSGLGQTGLWDRGGGFRCRLGGISLDLAAGGRSAVEFGLVVLFGLCSKRLENGHGFGNLGRGFGEEEGSGFVRR